MLTASVSANKVIAIFAALLLFALAFPLATAKAQEEIPRENPRETPRDNRGGGGGFGISIDIISLLKKKKKTPPAAPSVPAKKKPATQIGKLKSGVAPKSGVPPKGETRFRRAEVLFVLKPTAPAQALQAIVQAQNLNRIAETGLNLFQRTVHRYAITDGRSVAQVVAALETDPRVEQAQPNYIYELSEVVTAASPGLQYANVQLRIPEAHKFASGKNVLVAIIDSRVDTEHPALADAIRDSYSAVDIPSAGPDGHGTAMAGAIAGRGQLMGTAPGAGLLVAECFSKDEEGRMNGITFHILKAVDWAYGHSGMIQNMSFSGPRDPLLSRLMKAANGKGVVFLAAAGNAGAKSPPLYPAADENAIAVTAVDDHEKLFKRAVRGKHIAVAAPGVDVIVLAPSNSTGLTTGTSVATAHVSGLAALATEVAGKLDRNRLRQLFAGSARKLKAPRESIGAGVADALRLVEDAAALAPRKTVQQ